MDYTTASGVIAAEAEFLSSLLAKKYAIKAPNGAILIGEEARQEFFKIITQDINLLVQAFTTQSGLELLIPKVWFRILTQMSANMFANSVDSINMLFVTAEENRLTERSVDHYNFFLNGITLRN